MFYSELYQCVDDVQKLQQKMVEMQEAFAEQATSVLRERLHIVGNEH